MKIKNFLIIICLLVLTFTCKKTDIDQASDFKAKKNGDNWITTSSYATLNKISNSFMIAGVKRDPKYYQDENLYLSFTITGISQVNTIKEFSAKWMFVVGGDAISDQYQIDTISDNTIKIISLDTINKTISGTFKVKLTRDKYYQEAGEMRFTDGQFNLPYQEIKTFE